MAQKSIMVEVVTPYAMFYKGQVEMAVFTAKDGEIGIMPGHTPLMAALVSGPVRLQIDRLWQVISATNGYAEAGPDRCIIVVNAAEYPQDIDIDRAWRALARAQKKLKDPGVPEQEKAHARHAIERAENRIKIARQYQSQKAGSSQH